MKQSHIAALVLGVASITAGTAMAQSAKTNPWEGADVAASFGYAQFVPSIGAGTTSPLTIPLPPPAPSGSTTSGVPGNVSASADNVMTPTGSISAGYNWGITSEFLLGIRGSFYPGASASAGGTLTVSSGGGGSPINVPAGTQIGSPAVVQYNVKNLYSIVLTPGYAIDKDRLAYAKIGYTGATIGLNGPTLAYQTVGLTGYSLGLGYKQMISNSIYVLGEINYGKFSESTATVVNASGVNITAPFSGKGTDVLVGIGYRF